MKKIVFLITATLLSGLCWVGCNKSGKLNQSSTVTAPTGPVELKLKWPVGERVVQNFQLKMNMEISGQNLPNPIKQDMTLGERYGLNVLNADANGGHEVEMEFLGMQMRMDQGGKTLVDYDSEKKSSEPGKDPKLAAMEKMFQSIVGAKIHYFLDASNEVQRIEGVDALTSQSSAGGRADAASSMKSMFSEDSLKQMISGQHLPPKPVQPGDSWPVQMDIAMGELGTMALDYTFNFVRWETHGKRTCARLEFQGGMKSKSSPDSTATGMTFSVQNGDSSGVSWFDPELGLVIDTIMNQDMNVNMTVPMNGRGKKATQNLTNVMKQAITIKLESVK
jgi:hypothetical protein